MFGAISRIAVMTGISAALLAGCGNNVAMDPPPATSSKPPAVDLSTLDTGKYLTLPRRLGQVASEDEGRMAEAIRMAEAVADPSSTPLWSCRPFSVRSPPLRMSHPTSR